MTQTYTYLVTIQPCDSDNTFIREFIAKDSDDAFDQAQIQYEDAKILAACRATEGYFGTAPVTYTVKYFLRSANDTIEYIAAFQRIEEAQLMWDSMVYLREAYKVTSLRPR